MPITPKHFYMIRHGETEANAAGIMAGVLDSPLTETGRAQARAVHRVLPHLEVKPALIVHSQLSRARDTARIINEALNLPMVEDPDLGEMDAGDWEGQPWEVCSALFEDWVDAPGGETVEQFFTRLKRAKNKILMRDDAPALIVSHGGVLRAFGKFYGLETRPAFRNCHLHEFLPNETTPAFPWDVYHYDHEEELVRARAGIYHGTKY